MNDAQQTMDELTAQMDSMSREELKAMVLISANAIGTLLNDNETYASPEQAEKYLCEGMRMILTRYDTADALNNAQQSTN